MAAADIYARVHEVCFGLDPHRDVVDFMQRRGLIFRQEGSCNPTFISIYINTIQVTKHLQEQGLSAFYLTTTVIRQAEFVNTTQLFRLDFNAKHEEVERHLARVLDTTG